MRLLLSMLSWPDGAKPDVRDIDAELTIGRGDESGWTLLDPNSRLSRRHCLLSPQGEGWRVTDLSLNGTFINDSIEPLGRERSHELHDGDQIRIGAYVMEARYQLSSALRTPPPPPRAPFEPVRDNAFDLSGGGASRAGAWIPPAMPGAGHGLLDRHDPNDFVGQPRADHSPAISDNWQPPPRQQIVLPDDFDPATAEPHSTDLPSGAPLSWNELKPNAAAQGLPPDWDAAKAEPIGHAPVVRPRPPRAEVAPVAIPPADEFAPTELPVIEPPPASPPASALQTPADPAAENVMLAAFLRGAGLSDAGDADPVTMMERVGELLRLTVDRLRALQIGRAAIKREFRILATRVQLEDNNPIRFSASTDVALRALLTGKQRPGQTVAEVLDGIRLHELAMVAAMRDAVSELLETLNPERVRGGSEETGLAGILGARRKARAFDQYEALHAQTVRALTDDFDSVFGKAFARAYERVALGEDDASWRQRK